MERERVAYLERRVAGSPRNVTWLYCDMYATFYSSKATHSDSFGLYWHDLAQRNYHHDTLARGNDR